MNKTKKIWRDVEKSIGETAAYFATDKTLRLYLNVVSADDQRKLNTLLEKFGMQIVHATTCLPYNEALMVLANECAVVNGRRKDGVLSMRQRLALIQNADQIGELTKESRRMIFTGNPTRISPYRPQFGRFYPQELAACRSEFDVPCHP